MELGGIAKPPVAAAQPRPEAAVTAGAVRTELPKEAAVQAAPEDPPLRFEGRDDAEARARVALALRDMIDRNTEIDPKTREVVFQQVDRATGEVVRQVPDEALLRLRAYAREMREAEQRRSGEMRVERVA